MHARNAFATFVLLYMAGPEVITIDDSDDEAVIVLSDTEEISFAERVAARGGNGAAARALSSNSRETFTPKPMPMGTPPPPREPEPMRDITNVKQKQQKDGYESSDTSTLDLTLTAPSSRDTIGEEAKKTKTKESIDTGRMDGAENDGYKQAATRSFEMNLLRTAPRPPLSGPKDSGARDTYLSPVRAQNPERTPVRTSMEDDSDSDLEILDSSSPAANLRTGGVGGGGGGSSIFDKLQAIRPTESTASYLTSPSTRRRKGKPASTASASASDAVIKEKGTQGRARALKRKADTAIIRDERPLTGSETGYGSDGAESTISNLVETEAGAPTAKTKKKKRTKKRDRDQVEIVVSLELGKEMSKMKERNNANLLGLLMVRCGAEKNVRSFTQTMEPGTISGNRIEWRRVDGEESTYVERVAYWYAASEFVKLVQERTADDLARRIVTQHPGMTPPPLLLLYGVERYCKRQMTRGIGIGAAAGADASVLVSKEGIDDCLTTLWLNHGIRARHLDSAPDASEFLVSVAYAVGRAPYAEQLQHADLRRAYTHNKTHTSTRSLVSDGQGGLRPESNADLGSAYQALLALIPGCSADKAKAIRRIYPTLRALLDALDNGGVDTLVDVKDRKERRLGPVLATRIWTVLAGDDENARVA